MWPRLMSWVALAAVVGLSGCGAEPRSAREEPGRTSVTAPMAEPDPPNPSPAATPSARGVRTAIPTHCGVRSAWVDGELWLAAPRLGGHNPPSGWGENQTRGMFVITAPRRAVFHGDGGQRARFRLAAAGARDPGLGCE